MKISKGQIAFYIKQLTLEIYWPKILNNSADFGIFMPTQISYKKFNEYNIWYFHRAAVIKLLGFGVGIAWKHCDNPNIIEQ